MIIDARHGHMDLYIQAYMRNNNPLGNRRLLLIRLI